MFEKQACRNSWTLDAGRWTLDATPRKLGSGHLTLLSTGSEQKQNPVSDSFYFIESIGSNVKRLMLRYKGIPK